MDHNFSAFIHVFELMFHFVDNILLSVIKCLTLKNVEFFPDKQFNYLWIFLIIQT